MREWIIETLGGGATALAILVAIIGLAGVLGGAVTSYLVAQKTVYINAITAERMKWITSLKTNIATFLSILHSVEAHIKAGGLLDKKELIAEYKKLNEIASLLEMQMNPKGKIECNISALLDASAACLTKEKVANIEALIISLRTHARWMFKLEWHQVKTEASGSLRRISLRWARRRIWKDYREFSGNDSALTLALPDRSSLNRA